MEIVFASLINWLLLHFRREKSVHDGSEEVRSMHLMEKKKRKPTQILRLQRYFSLLFALFFLSPFKYLMFNVNFLVADEQAVFSDSFELYTLCFEANASIAIKLDVMTSCSRLCLSNYIRIFILCQFQGTATPCRVSNAWQQKQKTQRNHSSSPFVFLWFSFVAKMKITAWLTHLTLKWHETSWVAARATEIAPRKLYHSFATD